jgi:hypothetical protein
MTEPVEFDVGEAGPPRLNGAGEEGAPQPPVAGPVAVLAWTPQEVASAIGQWWNLGCIWFGPSWQARPEELSQVATLMAPYFDQWFPKGGAGDPGLVVVGLACLGTGITMALTRADVIAAHWRKPWIRQQLQAAQTAQAGQDPKPAGAGGTPAAADAEQGPSYKLPQDLAKVVDPGQEEPLAVFGI